MYRFHLLMFSQPMRALKGPSLCSTLLAWRSAWLWLGPPWTLWLGHPLTVNAVMIQTWLGIHAIGSCVVCLCAWDG